MTVKAIIFDFDGVIAETMDMKTEAFVHLFKDQSKETVQKIVKLHLDNGGMSRYEKFRIIYKEFLNENISKDKEEQLGKEFSDFVFEKTIKCPYVKGFMDFIKNNYGRYLFFIASGTPNGEINNVVDERNLRKYFEEVIGSPKTKTQIIKMILEKYNLEKNEVVFIGDAPTDYHGAEETGINFIARIPSKGYNPFEIGDFTIKHRIEDLTSLDKTLKTIDN
jgi:HAD superfamily hydrolase (TIGR01549 family)